MNVKLITVKSYKLHAARQTGSPCTRIDYKIAEKLQTIGLYFGWQTETFQPVTVIVAATDHVTCGGTSRGKRQWSELNRKNER